MIQGSANENDTLYIYNLVHKMVNTKSISKTQVVGHATCKMFFHSNKVTLVSGQFDDSTSTWKLRLYQFDTAKTLSTAHLSWKQVSRFNNLQLNLKNSIPVSYEKDGIFILVTDHRPLCKIFGSKQGIPPYGCSTDAEVGPHP